MKLQKFLTKKKEMIVKFNYVSQITATVLFYLLRDTK